MEQLKRTIPKEKEKEKKIQKKNEKMRKMRNNKMRKIRKNKKNSYQPHLDKQEQKQSRKRVLLLPTQSSSSWWCVGSRKTQKTKRKGKKKAPSVQDGYLP